MQNTHRILKEWPISDEEFQDLEKQFARLSHKQAWTLIKMNYRNNFSDEEEDIVQDMRLGMMKAAAYTKRQRYTVACFEKLREHCHDAKELLLIDEMESIWEERKNPGGGKRKFDKPREKLLEKLVKKYVPEQDRPNRNERLILDARFKTYCKTITWNEIKQKGKRITREKFWRSGIVSLSEHEFLR